MCVCVFVFERERENCFSVVLKSQRLDEISLLLRPSMCTQVVYFVLSMTTQMVS